MFVCAFVCVMSQVTAPLFGFHLVCPESVTLGTPFLLSLHLLGTPSSSTSSSTSSATARRPLRGEKLRVLVWLHEDLLIHGATNRLVEIYEDEDDEEEADEGEDKEVWRAKRRKAVGEEVLRLDCVALRAGVLSLPRIQVFWERRTSSNAPSASAATPTSAVAGSNNNNNNSNSNSSSGSSGGGERVFDLGEREQERRSVFVHPAPQLLL